MSSNVVRPIGIVIFLSGTSADAISTGVLSMKLCCNGSVYPHPKPDSNLYPSPIPSPNVIPNPNINPNPIYDPKSSLSHSPSPNFKSKPQHQRQAQHLEQI